MAAFPPGVLQSPSNPADNRRSALHERRDTRDLIGPKLSGTAILHELHLARVLLYAKIYRHKKVSAIETMIDALFEAPSTHPKVDVVRLVELCYWLCDDRRQRA
jgi:hypothetical protein